MFQPVVPLPGLPGWIMLNRTLETQTEAFNASPQITRDTDYFEATIGTISTAEELVSDRRLLRVALGAFGLEDDLNNRFLIRKVLEGGVADPRSLANALSDDRYAQLSEAFGFGGPIFGPRTTEEGFGQEITALFRTRSFEVAVGNQDESLRLAMNAERELQDIGQYNATDNARWYRIMGTPPLRQVFEIAFGLPTGFGQLDIDRQLDEFKEAARSKLGVESMDDFASAETRERLIQTYLLRNQIRDISGQSAQSIALTLLQT